MAHSLLPLHGLYKFTDPFNKHGSNDRAAWRNGGLHLVAHVTPSHYSSTGRTSTCKKALPPLISPSPRPVPRTLPDMPPMRVSLRSPGFAKAPPTLALLV